MPAVSLNERKAALEESKKLEKQVGKQKHVIRTLKAEGQISPKTKEVKFGSDHRLVIGALLGLVLGTRILSNKSYLEGRLAFELLLLLGFLLTILSPD